MRVLIGTLVLVVIAVTAALLGINGYIVIDWHHPARAAIAVCTIVFLAVVGAMMLAAISDG